MSPDLPDEIISEILSPALKVADEVFSDTSEKSPFTDYSESSSAYLLVCKSWLRVATPLLYNVVILRSKAQAKALGSSLSKNKELGRFVKKLRVEGGYGAPMGPILRLSPNISDLYISFEIFSADNTAGLCSGLPFISPTRVILRDSNYKRLANKMTVNLEVALVKAIAKWDRLVRFSSSAPVGSDIFAGVFRFPLLRRRRSGHCICPGIGQIPTFRNSSRHTDDHYLDLLHAQGLPFEDHSNQGSIRLVFPEHRQDNSRR